MKPLEIISFSLSNDYLDVSNIDQPFAKLYRGTEIDIAMRMEGFPELRELNMRFDIHFKVMKSNKSIQKQIEKRIRKILKFSGPIVWPQSSPFV